MLACAPEVQAQPDPPAQIEEASAARRHKRVRYYMRVRRPKPAPEITAAPVAEPELRRVRVIPIACSENAATFDEIWCHRIDRPAMR